MKHLLQKILNNTLLFLSIFFFFTSCNKSENYYYLDKNAYAIAGYYTYNIGDTLKLKINNDTLIFLNKSIVKNNLEVTEPHGNISHLQELKVKFNEIFKNTEFKIEVRSINNVEESHRNEYVLSFDEPFNTYTVFYDKDIKAKSYSDTIHSVFYNDLYKIMPNAYITIVVSKNKGILNYVYFDNFKVERVF